MHGFDFSNLLAILLAFFPALVGFFPGLTPPPPADRIAPIVRVERPRSDVFDRDENLLRLGGIEVRATDNVRVTGVTVELLRFANATATTPNGFYNFSTRTFVTTSSAATQTTATATTNPAIFRAAAGNFPQLTPGTTYAVRARARDAAGNTSTDVSRFTRRAGFSAQQTRITGRVVNSNGTPVVGVNVRSSASSVPVRTDATGRYELVNISQTGNIVVTPDPAGGTFNPTSRTVVVTSTGQGEIPNINFIRTGPPVTTNAFRPGAYRIDFVLNGTPSREGSAVVFVSANGVVSPTAVLLANGSTGSLQGIVSESGLMLLTITDTDGLPDEANTTLTNQNGIIRGSGQIVDTDAPGGSVVRGTFNATRLESGGPGANAFRPGTYRVAFNAAGATGTFHIFVNANGVATPTVIPFPDGTPRSIQGTISSTGQLRFTASDPEGVPDQINVNLANQNNVVSGSGQIVDTDPNPGEPSVVGTVTITKVA